MNVVCLSAAERRLLLARYERHGNSPRRMRAALLDVGAREAAQHIVALRRLERRFDVDLAQVCYRFTHRVDAGVHPLERWVMSYIAELHPPHEEEGDLWVLLDRLREVRDLMEGRLVGEQES